MATINDKITGKTVDAVMSVAGILPNLVNALDFLERGRDEDALTALHELLADGIDSDVVSDLYKQVRPPFEVTYATDDNCIRFRDFYDIETARAFANTVNGDICDDNYEEIPR
jgi:hypothetical protein